MGAWILFFIFCIPAVIAWVRDLSSRTAIVIFSFINALFLEITGIFGIFIGVILLLWAVVGRKREKSSDDKGEKTYSEANTVSDSFQQNNKEEDKDSSIEESVSIAKELTRLAELKDKGLLTEEEFINAKHKLLNIK